MFTIMNNCLVAASPPTVTFGTNAEDKVLARVGFMANLFGRAAVAAGPPLTQRQPTAGDGFLDGWGTHRVQDYADALGYSVRTPTRACRDAVVCSAKQVIDDRVILEANRLLAHGDLTAAAVGVRVGLPDPSAFSKFFRGKVGETPAGFRSRVRGP